MVLGNNIIFLLYKRLNMRVDAQRICPLNHLKNEGNKKDIKKCKKLVD